MSLRAALLAATAWVLSLFAVGTWARAQSPSSRWVPVSPVQVLAGEDIGFRVHWMYGRRPVGRLVVRVGGQWVEATIGDGPPNAVILPELPEPPRPGDPDPR